MRKPKEMFSRLAGGRYAHAGLVLAAAGITLYQFLSGSYGPEALTCLADNGRSLIYGIRSGTVTTSMPALGLLAAALEGRPALLAALPRLLMAAALALVYTYGCLRGGRTRGALYLLAAALAGFSYRVYNAEQVFLVLAIMLFLNVSALPWPAAPWYFLLRGLALGFSLLARSTLALYPPLLAARAIAASPRLRGGLASAALALLGAYALLLPWAGVNFFATGKVNFLEHERSVSNTVVGVLGAVYTAECNERALAGLNAEDSVLLWAAGRVAADPAAYLLSVARRLWHLVLMFPVLFPLAAAAVFLRRAGPDKEVLWLGAYLALVHCLFAIEERYFFPLLYLGAILIADAVPSAEREEGGACRRRAAALAAAAFLLLGALALWTEALLLLYPFRAGAMVTPAAGAAAAGAGDKDPERLRYEGERLLAADRTAEGRLLLERYLEAARAPDPELQYILRTVDDTPPLPEPPAPQPGRRDPRVYRLLRGLELGRLDAARRDLALAREAWNRTGNILRGTPYSADRRVLARIVETNDNFENLVMPRALLYWSPERRGKILAALEKIMPLTEELRLLRFLCSAPGDRDSAARLLGDIYSADPGRLIKRGPETVKRALAQLSKIYLRTIKSRGSGGAGALAALRGVPARAALYPGLVDMSLAGKEASGEEFEELVRRLRSGADPEAALRLYAARPDNPAYLALALSHDGAAPRALRIAVENPALLLRLASSELARGEKKNALGLLGWTENYARLEAGDRHAAALIYQEAGLFKEALRSLNQAASASPADGKLLNDRGVLVLLEGDSAAAEKDFRRALELSPDLPDAALNLASLLARKGERREAGDIYLGLLRRGDLEAGLRAAIERELAGVKE